MLTYTEDETADYAWLITTDHLAQEGAEPDSGRAGPHNAPDDLMARIEAGEGHTFELYDDDDELYYAGRLITTGDMGDEQHCVAPLDDFGMAWAGCTSVRWPGHPEWDCG